MILSIVAYGDPVLKKLALTVDKGFPNLGELINNMFETMKKAKGVGLAAPQVGKSIRLFIVDTSPFADDEENAHDIKLKDFKQTFINAKMIKEKGEDWAFNEGCLSIPKIREDVIRKPKIRIQYLDENFVSHEEEFDGLIARVIQHEYDHIEGKLFTDKINPLRKRLLKRRLNDISKGLVETDYKMKFPLK